MFNFLNRFKIPTLLGLTILIFGTGAGVFLVVMGNQTLTTQASPDQIPKNITFSNLTDTSATISWQTPARVSSFITVGQTESEVQTIFDDRDLKTPTQRNIHYITIKNLTPLTTYQFKIFSGKLVYPKILKFTTSAPRPNQNGYQPIIGSVINNNKPVQEGIAYLSIAGAYTQSALIKNQGSFIIPISAMEKDNLSDIFFPQDVTTAKVTIISDVGQSTAIFKLNNTGKSIGILKIGENLDLINNPVTKPQEPPPVNPDLVIYDLSNDNLINTTDYSITLRNFGKNPKDKQADFNKDGVVDKKDLDLISKKITEQKSSR